MPRLSRKFVKALEDLTVDANLDPELRIEVAGLLVRLFTSGSTGNRAASAPKKAEEKKPQVSEVLMSSLKSLMGEDK